MTNPIDLRLSNYFTGMPFILGGILAPIGLMLLFSPQPIVGAVMLVAGIAILTTHYRLQIDRETHQYIEYIWIFGMKAGHEKQRFDDIKYVFVKKIKVSQTLNSRASSTTIQKNQHEAYLKFSDQHKIHLITSDSKEAVLGKVRPIASQLSTRIIDYSVENPVEIK